MTIQVTSTTEPASPAEQAIKSPPVKDEGQKDEKSAPASQETPEHKTPGASESPETESEEGGEKTGHEGEDTPSHEDESAADGQVKDEKPKKKNGIQRRIDKLNARYADKEREAEYWRQEALKRANDPTPQPKVEPAKTAAGEDKPKPESYESHADYVDALTDWKIDQREKARDQKAEKSRLEIEQSKTLKTYAEREKDFAEKTDDYQETLSNLDGIMVSPAVRQSLLASENGPELAYELAKDRAEFERINALPPIQAAMELGKVQAKLARHASDDKKKEPTKITQAPKPLEPVGKSAAGSVRKSIHDPDISQSEYEQLRREQMKRRQA